MSKLFQLMGIYFSLQILLELGEEIFYYFSLLPNLGLSSCSCFSLLILFFSLFHHFYSPFFSSFNLTALAASLCRCSMLQNCRSKNVTCGSRTCSVSVLLINIFLEVVFINFCQILMLYSNAFLK